VTSNLRHFRFIAGLRLEQAPYRLPQSDSPRSARAHGYTA
jgi:hypothetical protein